MIQIIILSLLAWNLVKLATGYTLTLLAYNYDNTQEV